MIRFATSVPAVCTRSTGAASGESMRRAPLPPGDTALAGFGPSFGWAGRRGGGHVGIDADRRFLGGVRGGGGRGVGCRPIGSCW